MAGRREPDRVKRLAKVSAAAKKGWRSRKRRAAACGQGLERKGHDRPRLV